MARAKKKRRNSNGFRIPVTVVAGIAPGVGRLFLHATQNLHGQGNALANVGVEAGRIYLGYDSRDGSFMFGRLWLGLFPMILGLVAHRFASRLGINRWLANAGIPVLRV